MIIFKEPRTFETLKTETGKAFQVEQPTAAPRNRTPSSLRDGVLTKRAPNGEPLYYLV